MSAIQFVKFWINAFIPRHIPGYTLAVARGPHRGDTMIPGPAAGKVSIELGVPASSKEFVRAMSGLPHESQVVLLDERTVGISDCYLTDQRSFSAKLNAKSRMHSEFCLDLRSPGVVLTQSHRCDFTTELDCEEGCVECKKVAGTKRMKFSVRERAEPGWVIVDMECAANNPCAPISRMFGNIDYRGSVACNPKDKVIEFDGMIDGFPAFEAYVAVNGGGRVCAAQGWAPFRKHRDAASWSCATSGQQEDLV